MRFAVFNAVDFGALLAFDQYFHGADGGVVGT
jgi:hypothetical protein